MTQPPAPGYQPGIQARAPGVALPCAAPWVPRLPAPVPAQQEPPNRLQQISPEVQATALLAQAPQQSLPVCPLAQRRRVRWLLRPQFHRGSP